MSSLFNRTFSVLGGSLLCCCYGFHRPDQPIASAKPRGPHERSTASNVATKQFVRRIKPAGTCRERFLQRYQSPIDPIYQFGRYAIRGLHYGVGETVDPLLSTRLRVGGHHRSREGTPTQVCGTPDVEATHHHTCFVATCTPSFQRWHCRLSLGSRPFRCSGDTCGQLHRLFVLRLRIRSCDNLARLSIPNTRVHFFPEGFFLGEEIRRVYPHPAEATVCCTLTAY